MCIMEVKPGQHHSTITQACAHNINTVVGDLDMFTSLLSSRGDHELSADLHKIQHDLHDAYAALLETYCRLVAAEVHEHPELADITEGKTFEDIHSVVSEILRRDEHHAHPYETR